MKGEAIARKVNMAARRSFQATVSARSYDMLETTAKALDMPRRTLVEFLIMEIPRMIKDGTIEKYEQYELEAKRTKRAASHNK